MLKKSFILLILLFTVFALYAAESPALDDAVAESVATGENEESSAAPAEDGLYPEITSKNEWFLGREIDEYRYTGVSSGHARTVNNIFRKVQGKVFSYELLSDLQRDLYNTGYFEKMNPAVDINIDKKLVFVFDFNEIPFVNSIAFVSGIEGKPLAIREKDLKGVLDYSKNDMKTESEIKSATSALFTYYTEHGRPGTEINVDVKKNRELNCWDVLYTIVEDDERTVGEIVFEGNEKEKTSTLQKKLTSKKNGYLEDSKLKQDVDELEKYYRKNGYKDVAVEVVKSDIEEADGSGNDKAGSIKTRLTYKVNEGLQWKIGDVSFAGNTIFDSERLLKELSLKTGSVFDNEKFEEDKAAIYTIYSNQGYVFMVLVVKQNEKENGVLDLQYLVTEGKKAYIEGVEFTGLAKTKEYVFRRELTVKEGDPFSRDAIQKSFQNIYNTGLIKDLNYELKRGSDNEHLKLEVIIEEAQQMDLTFGITFGGTEGGFPLSFLASLNNKNLKGTGMTLSTGVQVTTDYQAVSLSFGSGWFKNVRWSNSFSFSFERSVKKNVLQKNPYSYYSVGRNQAFPYGYSSYEDFESFDESVPALRYLMTYEMYRLSLGYGTGYTWIFNAGRLSISGGLSIGLNHVTYNENEYTPFEYLIYQYRQGWKFSNRLSIGLTWDGRDYVDDPTKGYMLSQSFVYAGGFLFGLSNYIKSVTTASGYITLFTTGDKDEVRPRAFVGSYTTSVSVMLPQFWNTDTDIGNGGWRWHDAKYGATRSEMLYIDGMRTARGHSTVYDIAFMWDNMLEFSYPIVKNVVNAEIFGSMTAVSKQLESLSSNLIWYGAFGIGAKLKVSGFPLGIYLVGDFRIKGTDFKWIDGGLFNYVHPVLAISTSLI